MRAVLWAKRWMRMWNVLRRLGWYYRRVVMQAEGGIIKRKRAKVRRRTDEAVSMPRGW
jgi:hypothetical protein